MPPITNPAIAKTGIGYLLTNEITPATLSSEKNARTLIRTHSNFRSKYANLLDKKISPCLDNKLSGTWWLYVITMKMVL